MANYAGNLDDVRRYVEDAEKSGYAEFDVPNNLREGAAKLCYTALDKPDGRTTSQRILDTYARIEEARKKSGRRTPLMYAEENNTRGSFQILPRPDGIGCTFKLNLCEDDFD